MPDVTNSAEANAVKKTNPPKRTKYIDATDTDKTILSEGKLTCAPTDYCHKTHLPPCKKDFCEECCYWDFQAKLAQDRCDKCKCEAQTCRDLGSVEQRKAAKQLQKLKDKMAEVEAFLVSQGVNPETLAASAS